MGSAKAAVLPVPVCAMPIRSLAGEKFGDGLRLNGCWINMMPCFKCTLYGFGEPEIREFRGGQVVVPLESVPFEASYAVKGRSTAEKGWQGFRRRPRARNCHHLKRNTNESGDSITPSLRWPGRGVPILPVCSRIGKEFEMGHENVVVHKRNMAGLRDETSCQGRRFCLVYQVRK